MIMHVPCYSLPKLHKLLLGKGYGRQMNMAPSYGAAMREAGWRSA
jgi:fatty acid desaturase